MDVIVSLVDKIEMKHSLGAVLQGNLCA